MKIGENELATGSRPVWGVTSRPACFPIRRLAVPGFRISDRTGLRPFSYSFSKNENKKVLEHINVAHGCHQFLFLQQR